ncbi:MAG: hypothetical protein SF070_17170 [Gemmatimonadota bacterium]|nr:hypothetical protein [Gemmatimonadota bacterium]
MTAPESPTAESVPGPSRRRRIGKYLAAALLVPLLLLTLYTWLALHWDYSNGYRSGMLQKISKKGWVCKTYEGELWQSVVAQVAPNVWHFSVRDERVARQLDSLVGQSVRVHYTEHRGIPTTCFGDTPYYVDSVSVVAGP